MTVPIPVLLERPPVSSSDRGNRVKDMPTTCPVKSKFAQSLAGAVKNQKPREVNGEIKNQKTLGESRAPLTTPGKDYQAKDANPADSMSQTLAAMEDISGNETELQAMVNQPVIIEPLLAGAVAVQIDMEADDSKSSQSPVLLPLNQPAGVSEPTAIPLISQIPSDQPDEMAGPSIPVNNGNGKTIEQSNDNSDHSMVKPISVDVSGLESNLNHDSVADSSQKTDKKDSGQVLVTKMPHDSVIKKNAVQIREPEANNTSVPGSPVSEKTETNIQTDVKKIMAMESHIRSAKVVMTEAGGEKMEQNNSRSDPGQDSPKFNLLQNQTNDLQARATSSKILEFPVREQVDPKDLIQQIVKKADVLLKSDISEMKMQLKPEFLGKMLIKVTVEEGTVVTKIITENQHVKQVLEANLNSLRQNLEANGMKVEKTEVSVQLFNDGGGSYNESDSNRYPLWSEQQGQNRRSYSDNSYGLPEIENLHDLPEETVKYGIGSEGQVNYLI